MTNSNSPEWGKCTKCGLDENNCECNEGEYDYRPQDDPRVDKSPVKIGDVISLDSDHFFDVIDCKGGDWVLLDEHEKRKKVGYLTLIEWIKDGKAEVL